MSLKCNICGELFPVERSLHAHIKTHGMLIGDYYVQFYPKFDKWTKEPIPFKNINQYKNTDFRHKKNMYKWLDSCEPIEAASYCSKVLKEYCEEKGLKGKSAPNHLFFLTHPRLPKIQYYDKFLNLTELFGEIGLIQVQNKKTDNLFAKKLPLNLRIAQDTREQNPLPLKNSEQFKLDCGDYSLLGENYNYVFVDRKSESDFKGTMASGYERFRRELDRVRQLQSYLFIVTESDPRQIYQNNNLPFKKASNLDYVWENMRNIILDYSDVCQFVFTSNRKNSVELVPRLLFWGNDLKNVDVQRQLEDEKWLG